MSPAIVESIVGFAIAGGLYIEGFALIRALKKEGKKTMGAFEDAMAQAEQAQKSIATELARVSTELDADAKKITELLANAGQPGADAIARLQAHAATLAEAAANLHNLADAHAADVPAAPVAPAPVPAAS